MPPTILTALETISRLSVLRRDDIQLAPDAILQYVPSANAAYAFGALYAIAFVGLFYHTLKRREWWFLCLPIGAACESLGFFLRIGVRKNQSSLGLFIIMNLLIVLSPATYLAFNYIVYGRLIVAVDRTLDGKEGLKAKSPYSRLPPRLVGRIFIWSDVITFIIQASGGAMESSSGDTAKIGDKIFLVGIIAQGLSYLLFCFLTVETHLRLHSSKIPGGPLLSSEGGLKNPSTRLFYTLCFSSIFILIRSVYRIIELAGGYNGTLYTHEIYFLVLDSTPLLFAIYIYILVWPGTLLERLRVTVPVSGATHVLLNNLNDSRDRPFRVHNGVPKWQASSTTLEH